MMLALSLLYFKCLPLDSVHSPLKAFYLLAYRFLFDFLVNERTLNNTVRKLKQKISMIKFWTKNNLEMKSSCMT